MKNTEVVVLNYTETDDNYIKKAAEIIKNGGLVAFPTETVYGLGANALDENASAKIYAAKGRPSDNPLIIHISSPKDAEKYAYVSPIYLRLAEKFMPGPLTVILPKKDIVPLRTTGGLDSVAVRCPENIIARKLIKYSGVPIAAPSANTSGRPSPTSAFHVYEDMNGKIEMILDGGKCEIGLESTIVKIDGDEVILLRPGKISIEQLKEICPNVKKDAGISEISEHSRPLAPGMKYTHYAPKAPVFLIFSQNDEKIRNFFADMQKKDVNCGILCYNEDEEYLKNKNVLSLGEKADINAHAYNLFEKLRQFDQIGVTQIFSRMPSDIEKELAFYNRLLKAAGFKILNLDIKD